MAKKQTASDKFNITREGAVIIGQKYGKLAGKRIDLSSITVADAQYLCDKGFPYIKEKKSGSTDEGSDK